MSNGDLWSGVNLKLDYAGFFLTRMQASLEPPPRTAHNVALEASGAILATNWQQSFYANFDAFLAMTRSVPEIINCCFGEDSVLRDWLRTLPNDEQQRRKQFSDRFRLERNRFRGHYLTNERNNSLHRIGVPGVTVAHTGLFGVQYVGTAVTPIPGSESPPIQPGVLPPGVIRAVPVRPRWSDFTIDGKPLFDECHAYVALASKLVEEARKIVDEVHGFHSLTPFSL